VTLRGSYFLFSYYLQQFFRPSSAVIAGRIKQALRLADDGEYFLYVQKTSPWCTITCWRRGWKRWCFDRYNIPFHQKLTRYRNRSSVFGMALTVELVIKRFFFATSRSRISPLSGLYITCSALSNFISRGWQNITSKHLKKH
jgi:hypothetical protein